MNAGLRLRFRRFAATPPRGIGDRLLRALLFPFGLVYGCIMLLRRTGYRSGWLQSWRAPLPVISVGNLALGGSGKTPLVDWLVRQLRQQGLRVGVVSRRDGAEPVVVSRGNGPEVPPAVGGDEPCLLARRQPEAIVVVAARRRLAIERAHALGAEVVIMDDGFQHLAVARDLDLVVLDGRAPLGNGAVFPAGLLREFPRTLSRADLLIVSGGDGKSLLPAQPPLIRCRRQLSDRVWGGDGTQLPLTELASRRVLAVAGIAEPERFFAQLAQAGVTPAATLALPDHASYDPSLLTQLRRQVEASAAELLLTTEKDAVKLQGAELGCPWYALPLEIELEPAPLLLERVRPLLPKERKMELTPDWLALLACPQCKGPVELQAEAKTLCCPSCRLAFPIRDGIPVMLLEEARPLEEGER